MHSLLLIYFPAFFIATAHCTTLFSEPPNAGPDSNYRDNPTYKVGEKIDIQWTSDLDTMDLIMWQQYPTASETTAYNKMLLEDSRSTSLIWTVTLDGFSQDVAKGEDAIFYLAVYESGDTAWDGTSHYFNISVASLKETTASSSASLSAAAPTPTTDTASSSTPTKSTNSEVDSDSGLSKGAVAGVAVGATLGGILVFGALGFMAWRYFRKRSSGGQYIPGQESAVAGEHKYDASPKYWNTGPPQEMPAGGDNGLYEAP